MMPRVLGLLSFPLLYHARVGAASASLEQQASLVRIRNGEVPDPFVNAAPLVVAVHCRNGVALVALHHPVADPLLFFDDNDDAGDVEEDDSGSEEKVDNEDSISRDETAPTTESSRNGAPWKFLCDLPRWYGGPFRIHNLDQSGRTAVAMMSTGWRADTERWIEYARLILGNELDLSTSPFSLPSTAATDATVSTPGVSSEFLTKYITQEITDYLAQTVALDSLRLPSCAGLLVTALGSHGNCPIQLWLVDVTGAYRVRAHALGGGAFAGAVSPREDREPEASTWSNELNARLEQVQWTDHDVDTGLQRLLGIIEDLLEAENTVLPLETRFKSRLVRVEIATVDSSSYTAEAKRRSGPFAFRRHLVSSLSRRRVDHELA
jgi:hypothetical protein